MTMTLVPTAMQVKRRTGLRILFALVAAIALPELLISLAEWVGSRRWRTLSYEYGAFWAGLLRGWRPNYQVQPVTMFVSYAFLHASFTHMLGNLLGLLWLGLETLGRAGTRGLVAVYLSAMLGGALAFGLVVPSSSPMVGASGAVFGLAGACSVWEARARRRRSGTRAGVRFVTVCFGVFVALNLASWMVNEGALAWQTHLGGALAGALVAVAMRGPGARRF